MKKIVPVIFSVLMVVSGALASGNDLEIQGKTLVSKAPPFLVILHSNLQLVHSSSAEYPSENSMTRAFFLVKERERHVEELLIVQTAERTNPQTGPMAVPPLSPYAERNLYLRGKVKKGEVEVEYLIQRMAWNPNASSLQPLVKKGLKIPAHWALQAQILFQSRTESTVSLRYSRDIHSFGLKVSEDGKAWDRESISGDEKKVYESFSKAVSGMIESLRLQYPK